MTSSFLSQFGLVVLATCVLSCIVLSELGRWEKISLFIAVVYIFTRVIFHTISAL